MKVLRPLFTLGFGVSLGVTGCIFSGDDDDDDDGGDCVTTCEDTHEQCTIDCDDDACIAVCDDDLEVCKTDCE
jgi:hypothetical protein